MSTFDSADLSVNDKVFCRPIPTVKDKNLYFLIKITDKIEGGYEAVIFRTSDKFEIKTQDCEFMQLTKENEIKIFKDKLLGGKNGKIKTYIASLESTCEKYVPDEDDNVTSSSKETTSDSTISEKNISENAKKEEESNEEKPEKKDLKRKRNNIEKESSKAITEPEIDTDNSSLKIPQWIKEYLYKDFVQVSKEEKEYPLIEDKSKSVRGIIDAYLKVNEEQSKDDFGVLKHSMDGLLQFFDGCFEKPFSLLYLTENSTFKNKVKETTPSLVYGLPHLLRFCVSLPSIFAKISPEISLEQETILIIYRETEKLFNYLEENLQSI